MAQVLERSGFVPAECSADQLVLWAAVTKTDLHTAAVDLCEKFHLDVLWFANGNRPWLWSARSKKPTEKRNPYFLASNPASVCPQILARNQKNKLAV